MPVKSCTLPNGKSGYKWGDSGKCYASKEKAHKQGIAIELSKKRRGEPSEFDTAAYAALLETATDDELCEILNLSDFRITERADILYAAKMTRKSINDLPDSDFAYIEPGGKKDETGKTVPKNLRHLPINDEPRVRNALARLSQTDISPEAKKSAFRKIASAAKKFGIEVSEELRKKYG